MSDTMKKTILTSDLDPEIRHLVREVVDGNLQVTIEENGRPVALVIPYDAYATRAAARSRFMDSIREMQETANLSPMEADELALEAVKSVRSQSS